MRSGRPVSVVRTNLDTAGVGDPAFGQPVDLVGDINAGREQGVLERQRPELLVQPGGVRAAGGRHVRQRAAQPDLQPGRAAVGPRAVQELQPGRHQAGAVPGRVLQLPEPSELGQRADRHAQRRHPDRGSVERQLRPHHVEDRPARHSVERAVHLLGAAARAHRKQRRGASASRRFFLRSHRRAEAPRYGRQGGLAAPPSACQLDSIDRGLAAIAERASDRRERAT